MLTSLLGLERYLRTRGATMPASVSTNWMLIGTVFALAVMLIMLLLPSPSLSSSWQDALGFLTTNNKDTSVHAIGDDGQEDGDNPKKEKQDQDAKGAKEKPGDKGSGQGDKGEGGDKKSDAKGNDSAGDKKSNSDSDSKKNSESKQNQQGDKSDKSEQDDAQGEDNNNQQGDDAEKKDDGKQDQSEEEKNKDGNRKRENDAEKNDQQNKNNGNQANKREREPENRGQNANRKRGGDQNAQPPKQSNSRPPSRIAKFIGSVMKYLIYIIGLVAFVAVLWMFRKELAKLWAELLGKKKKPDDPGENDAQPDRAFEPLPVFSQFKDPFSHGMVVKWPTARTIQHSFQALEAWARGHHCPREHDQTPLEFAKQLRQVDKEVATEARCLADLIGESLYSGGAVDRSEASRLQRLWQLMNANVPAYQSPATAQEMQLTNDP